MKDRKPIRLDRFFGLLTLIALLAFSIMVYNDFFREKAVDESEETENLSQVSDNKNRDKDKEENKSTEEDVVYEKTSKKVTVCLDPAKGGDEKGVPAGKYFEKNINMNMAEAIGRDLEKYGITVVLTRTSDSNVSDAQRASECNKANSDVCISLRMNSFGTDKSVSGAECYVHTSKKEDTVKLAETILKKMASEASIKNRGCKYGTATSSSDNYNINVHSKCTSCVLNMGFATNDSDLNALTNNKDATAKVIAAAIVEYLKQAGLF